MTFKKITTTVVATAALALAAVPAVSAQEQEAMSPDQQYAYTCGHLGTDCGEAAPERKKARRACGKRNRANSGRAKSSARKRCARRAGARR